MKKLKLSEVQILAMLKEGEAGAEVGDLCRRYAISKSGYYNLRSKYSGMDISDLKRLKDLEKENGRLKRMYAEISLEHQILRDIVEKN